MTAEDKLDIAVQQRNHKIGVFLTGNAKDALNAFCFKAFYK